MWKFCRIEVFDDDGKKGPDGKDKLLGTGYFSLKELEASATVHAPLQVLFAQFCSALKYIISAWRREEG